VRLWVSPGLRNFRYALLGVLLCPAAASAGPSLPPAHYVAPVVGAVLDYGKWRCEVADVSEYGHSCVQGGRKTEFYGRFFIHGPADRDEYGMSQPVIWCPGVRDGDFRNTPPLVLRDEARRAARSIWPLEIGKKARFIVHDREGKERIDLSIRVDGTESISWKGQSRNVYRVSATAEFNCNDLTGEWAQTMEPPAEYTVTWWYDPVQRQVLKKRRDWPSMSVTENQALRSVRMPAATAQMTPPAPYPAPPSPFAKLPVPPPPLARPPAPPARSPNLNSDPFELAFWQSIQDSKNPEDFKAYLRQFPQGRFLELARLRSRPTPVLLRTPRQPRPTGSDSLDNIQFGAYHALVIGNNNYRHLTRLKTAVNDASDVAEVLRRHYGFSVNLLLDATRAQILRALAKLRATLKFDDNLMIYYAGHGLLDDLGQQGYWLPVDAEDGIPTNWISTSDITVMLRAIRAKHAMVVADSCYSGTLVRAGAAPPENG
jgi:hypothetical protein